MEGYKKAQKEALDTLRFFTETASLTGVRYSVIGNAMKCLYYGYEFDRINPNSIAVAVEYEDYHRIIKELKERIGDDYLLIDGRDTPEFDDYACHLAKPNRVVLPEKRKADEIYYYTHITILPIQFAGNTLSEARKYQRQIKICTAKLNSRMPLPKKRLFSPIRGKIRRTKARYYSHRRQRENLTKQDLYALVENHAQPSEYMLVQNMILERCELEYMEADFYGVTVSVFKNYVKLVKAYYSEIKEPKVSDLFLRGGEDLRRIQLIQLDLLKEFDRICRKCHLKYNIAFGTLLGAVRHGGFIPWDDDVDVNMPVDDYLKFEQVVKEELDTERYYFRNQSVEEDCNITYAHLKRNGTIYTKPGRDGFQYHPGIYLDIVPLFNGAPCFLLHVIHTKICWFFRTACWAYMGADSEKKFLKRLYYKALARIGNKRAFSLFWKSAVFFRKKTNKMAFFNGMDRSPYNCGFVRRDGFENAVEFQFEGCKFWGPANYKEVMEYCYGKEYYKYPPMTARKPKNNVLIKLNGLYAYDGEREERD